MTTEAEFRHAFRNRWNGHEQEAITLLGQVVELLNGIFPDEALPSAMPMFGTLLGLVRNNALIPWDDDLDLLIFGTHYLALKAHLNQQLQTPPYQHLFLQTHAQSGLLRLCSRNSPSRRAAWPFVDLFCAQQKQQHFVIERQPTLRFSRAHLEPFTCKQQWGLTLRWPSAPQALLFQHYGCHCLKLAQSPRWCHETHQKVASLQLPLLKAIQVSRGK